MWSEGPQWNGTAYFITCVNVGMMDRELHFVVVMISLLGLLCWAPELEFALSSSIRSLGEGGAHQPEAQRQQPKPGHFSLDRELRFVVVIMISLLDRS